ncbi:hypothetical protein ACR77J_07905 [Tissierella praeacuta]|uniref:hypothetical protein n=1 Tax=Tissierella praeacuta TaxID=43131 RepID=UPI003DA5DD3F
MISNTILEQRRATKRAMIKKLKITGLDKTLNKIEQLKLKFPYNIDYYVTLQKGLTRMSANLKESM